MNQRFDPDSELMIDALRGIAALLVLVTHSFDLSVVDVFGWDETCTPELWRWARASAGYGGYWVWCFFMISGLCIHRSISHGVMEGGFGWRRYAGARLTRIYPLFLLGLGMAFAAWALHEDWGGTPDMTPWRQLAASLLSLQIITTPFPGFETSWSLSCEMIYYAAWPAILLPLRGRVAASVLVGLAGSLLTVAAVLFTWRVLHKLEHSAAVDGIWTVAVLFPVWLCGAWLAGNWQAVTARITRRMWLLAIGLCVVAESLLIVLKYMRYPGWAVHLASWASIPGLLIFLAGARHARLSRFSWARPVCRWLGLFSYPCYILHMQVLLIWNHFLVPLLPKSVSSHPLLDFIILLLPVALLLALIGPPLERAVMRWRGRALAPVPVARHPVSAA